MSGIHTSITATRIIEIPLESISIIIPPELQLANALAALAALAPRMELMVQSLQVEQKEWEAPAEQSWRSSAQFFFAINEGAQQKVCVSISLML